MNTDTTPNHRPNKWARLKAKLRQERAEADRLNTQLQWAHLFIAKTGRWQDFEQWLTQEATDSNDTAKLTDSVCTYFVQALNQAQAEADQAKHRLTVAQMMGNTYAEQKTAYYKMIETLNAEIDRLLLSVDRLTDRVITQREEIATLQRQAKGI